MTYNDQTQKICPVCQTVIPPRAPEGLCPSCLLRDAAEGFEVDQPCSFPRPELSNYEVVEMIGRGGMGVVYKARQKGLERLVALKVIVSGCLAGEREVRRFEAEAIAAAKLRHPNIVTIHEVGQENGYHFFSMEYVEGPSLAQALQTREMKPGAAAELMRKVAVAVEYAHEQGILHRDLKPTNILIDANGEPKVTDFGLARLIGADSDLDRSGRVMGTPSYMPPEQVNQETGKISVCSDVYALGATLYEALTGRPPFRGETVMETLKQVVELPPAAPRLLNPKVPRDLEVIALKCLRKQPLQRYGSARELAEDLGRFLRREPISARPIGIVERNIGWCLRNPIPATALMGVALLMMLLAVSAFFATESVFQGNRVIATRSARLLTNYLNQVSAPVVELAGNQEFARMLVPPVKTNELRSFLRARTDELAKHPGLEGVFQNWAVLAANGDLIGRVSIDQGKEELGNVPTRTGLINRSPRQYFQGAIDKFRPGTGPQVYISEGYESVDDHLCKIGLSSAIPDPEDPTRALGVIALMLKGFSTEDPWLGLHDQKVKTAVLARWDQSASMKGEHEPPQWVLWLHPEFRKGAVSIPVRGDPGVKKGGRSWFYSDPAARIYPQYRGRWVAVFAEVPNHPTFVVVVQSRNLLGAAVVITLISLLAGSGAYWIYRRRKQRLARPV